MGGGGVKVKLIVGDWHSGISRLIVINAAGKQECLTTVFFGRTHRAERE
jgi:hypothetical protein